MAAVISFINAFFTNVITAFGWILDGVLWILKTVVFFIMDGLLTVVLTLVQSLNLSTLLASGVMDWSGLPTQLIYMINQVGIPQGLALIAGAIVIRMIINLIPAAFTRI